MSTLEDEQTIATQAAIIAQLTAGCQHRQERIWKLEDELAKLRRNPPFRNQWQLWGMYTRESQERHRLLERNRKLTGKLLRRAREVGHLRAGNRALLKITAGTTGTPPE